MATQLFPFTFIEIIFLNRFAPLIYTIAGALLLWAAWPVSPFTFLIFGAWVPLLFVEATTTSWKKLFWLTYLHMVLWNVLTTWWIINASAVGASMAFIANSFLMCIPVLCFHFTKKRFGNWIGYASFIIYWMAFEYLHMNWDLSWPWLTLGNVFATKPGMVQWYEYTGVSGGTLWVLLSNLLIFSFLSEYRNSGRSKKYFLQMGGWILLVAIPMLVSKSLQKEIKIEDSKTQNIVIVQPNIDPYDEKFTAGTQEAQLHKLISLSEKQIDSNTALVVWPETAVPFQTDETQIKENFLLQPLWNFLKKHPQINLVTGVEGVRFFKSKNSPFAHPLENDSKVFYESYNSAAIFDSSSYSIYHKSRLVPGVEVLPSFLKFLDKIFEKFGGTTGGYAKDTAAKVLQATHSDFKVAPAICYESVYGDYMTEFMRKGANVICIITNDGWWRNTPGYMQHMNYARLRAIEARTWVVRSANTGISCFIDPQGNVYDPQPWDTTASIKMDIPVSTAQTFYVKHGDILSRAVTAVALVLLLVNIVAWIMKRFFKKKFPGTVN